MGAEVRQPPVPKVVRWIRENLYSLTYSGISNLI